MKFIGSFLLMLIATLLTFNSSVQAWLFGDILKDEQEIGICKDGECGLGNGIEAIKNIKDIETERSASVYLQDVLVFVLSFLGIIAVIYVIYGWFLVFSSGWDDERVGKWKKVITYALFGILVIFLAYSVVLWFIKLLI